jgi:hypothetical protein
MVLSLALPPSAEVDLLASPQEASASKPVASRGKKERFIKGKGVGGKEWINAATSGAKAAGCTASTGIEVQYVACSTVFYWLGTAKLNR